MALIKEGLEPLVVTHAREATDGAQKLAGAWGLHHLTMWPAGGRDCVGGARGRRREENEHCINLYAGTTYDKWNFFPTGEGAGATKCPHSRLGVRQYPMPAFLVVGIRMSASSSS